MNNLRSLLIITLLGISLQANAQHTSSSDTLELHKVMLIPYDPRYYLSDADRDIMEQSKKDPEKFRSDFRHNIDRHVQRAIGRSYYCISLLNDTADALQETLYTILGRTGYRYEKAIPITPKHVEVERTSSKDKANTKTHEDSKTATSYIPVKNDAVYMHAVVSKPAELFAKISEEYDADYFVFLTQFDIKTNYNSCMDIARKIYRREVMVHFSIYDKHGKVIAGSYATSFFPSDSNNANSIIGDCFPEIAAYIAGCLP
jgi:hypothetical protein